MNTKEHILAEIRRTAVNGRAVGKERFFRLTGIHESPWAGRYWLRWSDALREAGFAPNTLNKRTPDSDVFEPLAKLTRELGRFPLAVELRARRVADPAFPSEAVLRRVGTKPVLARKLRDYAETNGYDDVVASCALVGSQEPEAPSTRAGRPDLAADDEVYMWRLGKYHYIGRSNDAGRRLYEHRRVAPGEAQLVHKFRTDDAVGIERYWHDRFKERRYKRSLYELTPDDVRAFRRRKAFM